MTTLMIRTSKSPLYQSGDRETPIMAAFANYSGAIFRIGITAFAQLSFHLSVIADHSLICA
jgi:hypothetical protein